MIGIIPNARCTMGQLQTKIIDWLNRVRPPGGGVEVCFDYQTDWDLFLGVLGQDIPVWCKSRLVANHINDLLVQEYHKNSGFPEHHALYDAQANRYAFREGIAAQNITDFRI